MNKSAFIKFFVFPLMILIGTAIPGHAAKAKIFKWAHVYEVSTAYHVQALWAAEEINKRTKGRYEINVFPASSLGKEADINQGLTLGTVDIIYTGPSFIAQTYGPIAISDAAYIFRDLDHWKAYIRSDLFRELAQGYSRASGGNIILSSSYYGSRQVTSSKPINIPADMKGLKIRVPNAPLYKMFPNAVGAKPTPIAFAEVYLALQQGVVDAQENPLSTIQAKKFYEVQKYISLTGHMTGSLMTIIGPQRWKKLSNTDKNIFRKVMEEAAERVTRDIVKAENDLIGWFRKQGTTILEVDRKPFRDMTIPFQMKTGATWTQKQYDKLQAIK